MSFIICVLILSTFFPLFGIDTTSEKIEPNTVDSIDLDYIDTSYSILPPQSSLISDPILPDPRRYNPLKSIGMSIMIPGLGQFFCKKRIRAGLFFSTVGISSFVSLNQWNRQKNDLTLNVAMWKTQIDDYFDTLMTISPIDTTNYKKYYHHYIRSAMGHDLSLYQRRVGRSVAFQAIGWTVGLYLWNTIDALNMSNHFYDSERRSPKTAAWLSAIPFLGLGQVYNGSLTKVGFIWVTHSMLAYMAYNSHNHMNDCLNSRNKVKNTTLVDKKIINGYIEQWRGEYDSAFKKRNTYLWYFILFYFYGIFDASVDAHLHDYQKKIKLSPEILSQDKTVSINLKMNINF